jgi:tyrosine-protein kinase Etk/Wzc
MSTTFPQPADGGPQTTPAPPDDEEIKLLDVLLMLWEHKWLLIASTLGAGVLAAAVTLLMPSQYTATARILPPQQGGGSAAAALLGQLGGVGNVAGGIPSIRNPGDLYVGMLKSRTVGDRIVERFNLSSHFGGDYPSDARIALGNASAIQNGRDGIISISITSRQPTLSADIANAYVDELIQLTSVLAVTEASMRRLFFERQLATVRENLNAAELAAREAFARGGLAVAEAQGRGLIEASTRIRAQISAKEVQLGAMRTFASERNAELQIVQNELNALRLELARVEGGAGDNPSARLSAQPSNNTRLLRELRYQEMLQELLVRQLEAARLDEAREASIIQVLDRAVVPDRRSSPKRTPIVLLAALCVFLLVAVGVAIARSLKKELSRRRSAAI